MGLFRPMDLYKGIILLSLPMMLAGGYWVWSLRGTIDKTEKSILEATKQNGLLDEIGALQKQMETVKNNRSVAEAAKEPGRYFDKQIIASAAGGGISSSAFTIPSVQTVKGSAGKQHFLDIEQSIVWGGKGSGSDKKDMPLPRDFLWAVLLNCESGSGSGGVATDSVWKLRQLEIVNANEEAFRNFKTPPAEIEDKWLVKKMMFARREPDK